MILNGKLPAKWLANEVSPRIRVSHIKNIKCAAKNGTSPKGLNENQRKALWNKLDTRTQDFLTECKTTFNSEVMRICLITGI